MNTSNKRTPKLLSLLLIVCMVLSLLPTAALAAETDIPIDEAHFPDANFRTYVLENCDTDKNTVLSAAEAAAVTQIDVQKKSISSLKGIEFFTQLTELDCGGNQLSNLDLRHNSKLTSLTCWHNLLTSLDLSNKPNLEHLDCGANQITSLDLSNKPNLKHLDCGINQIISLDLSNKPNLEYLDCSVNQITSLDLSKNPKLTEPGYRDNKFTIEQRVNATLPGKFDASKVSNVVGGKFDTAKNTFSFDDGANEATYQYDTGYTGIEQLEPLTFKLVYQEPTEPETKPAEPEDKPIKPENKPIESENKPIEPETKPTEPETKPTVPETKPTEPENKPIEPETKPTEPAQNPFTDIAPDKYFYEPVLWAVNNGITSGISADKFGPSINCTRGQIATFLWAAASKPEPTSTSNPFTDVAESDYYYKAVLWAVEKGITSGMSADKFGPKVTCTRAQTVTFLWAAQGKPVVQSAAAFSDVASGDYYYNAVKWAVENKVTAGVGDDRFGPSQDCLRGQIVTFLYKTFA